jgi:uncharacterized protein YbcI
MTDGQTYPSGATQAALSNAVVRLYRDCTGRGPTQARTLIQDDTVVVVLSDLLTRAEQRLVADGRHVLVLAMRQTFQESMREELTAAVEMLTHRQVVGFMSGNQLEPDMACEVFILADAKPI